RWYREHLFGDSGLLVLVRREREIVDESARGVRRVAHRDHLRGERGRLGLEDRLEHRDLNQSWDDLIQDGLWIRLEQVLKRRQLVDVLLFRDERQEPPDGRLLAQGVHEPGEGEIELVDLAGDEFLNRDTRDRVRVRARRPVGDARELGRDGCTQPTQLVDALASDGHV